MKKVYYLIGLALAAITFCIIYLVVSGISLRSAALIQPSVISNDKKNISASLVHRLFQDFQQKEYILWGISSSNNTHHQIITDSELEYRNIFHKDVSIIDNVEQLKFCQKPCWLITDQHSANGLDNNIIVLKNSALFDKNYFSITIIDFTRHGEVPDECQNQKRISYKCITPLSVREVTRKLKKTQDKYFFLRKYNETDHFLFIE